LGDAARSLVDTSPQTWSKQPSPAQMAWRAPRVLSLQKNIKAAAAGTRYPPDSNLERAPTSNLIPQLTPC